MRFPARSLLGGTRSAAQADLSAMAKSFGFAGDSMEKVLQTADKVQGMSFSEAKKTLGGLGVEDNGTVEMLMKGREELSRMMETQKDYGGITRESIEQSISFNNAMLSTEQSAGLLKNSLMGMLIPALAQGLDWLEKSLFLRKKTKILSPAFYRGGHRRDRQICSRYETGTDQYMDRHAAGYGGGGGDPSAGGGFCAGV